MSRWRSRIVNSEPALVVRVGQRLESLFVLSIEGETISAIRVVRNPEKLARIDRQLTTHSEGSRSTAADEGGPEGPPLPSHARHFARP
jgi:hypothetical protein